MYKVFISATKKGKSKYSELMAFGNDAFFDKLGDAIAWVDGHFTTPLDWESWTHNGRSRLSAKDRVVGKVTYGSSIQEVQVLVNPTAPGKLPNKFSESNN